MNTQTATTAARVYFQAPTECPSCKTTLTRDGEYLVCKSLDCDAQAAGGIKRWVEKVGVLHVGEALIEAACAAGLIKDAADLYAFFLDANDENYKDPHELSGLDMNGRVAGGSADKALNNLKAKMTLPLHVIVGSVGIPMIGRSMAKTIVDGGYNSLSKMMKARVTDIAAIPGVGPSKAQAFVEGFQDKAGLIGKLIAYGIQVQVVGGQLLGKSFCFTGFRDAELQDTIEKQGGTVKSSASKDLTYLVAQDPNGTSGKLQAARKNGTQVIGQDEAWILVGGKV